MTHTAQTNFQTEKVSSYLQQLCKHFGHKLEVEFTPEKGTIKLPMGACQLDASSRDNLQISVSATDEAALEKTKDVIVKHLERFAFREKPIFEWS